MAGFGDNNDIKINVTLDTEAALKAAQELKTAIESSLKVTEEQFNKVKQVATQLSSALDKLAKAEVSGNKEKLNNILSATEQAAKKEIALAEEVANKKAKAAQKAEAMVLEAAKVRARDMESIARREAEQEKTRRTQLLKDIAQLNKDRAIIRKTPRAELPSDLGGVSGAGKLLDALGKSAAGVGLQIGSVNVAFGTLLRNLAGIGGIGGGAVIALGAIAFGADKLNSKLIEVGNQASQLEGLKTGFENLQRGVGADPAASIERLRQATQGLISDTELYQKANQAVLLNVPTDVFNEAAGAAVKLGRAMGIDAAFAIESLSLGLGRQSRLYLDNLGIVVSAEEAYKNFAIANNIVGRTLTDAEKRAAFFEESLRKIRERAAELPDVLDSVGVATTKVGVAQQNVNSRYLEGFNQSFELAKAYKDQAAIIQNTSGTSELFGRQLAKLSAGFVDSYNSTLILNNGLKSLAVSFLDLFVRADPEKQIQDLNKGIENSTAIIEKNAAEIRDFGGALSDTYTNIRVKIIQNAVKDLEEAKAKIKALGVAIGEVRDEAGNPIKIKVDISEILAGQTAFNQLKGELRQDILATAGKFEIPGLSEESLKRGGEVIKNLQTGLLSGKVTVEQFNAEFDKTINALGEEINTSEIVKLRTDLENLSRVQATTADESVKLAKDIETARVKLIEQAKATGLSKEQTELLTKAIKKYAADGSRAFQQIERARVKDAKSIQKGLKKQLKEFEDFADAVERTAGTAVPDEFKDRIVDLFLDTTLSSEKFADKLKQLGKDAAASGVDLNELKTSIDGVDKAFKKTSDRDALKAAAGVSPAAERLAELQKQSFNLKATLDKIGIKIGSQGGAFFGYDLGSFLSEKDQAAIASQIQSSIVSGITSAFDASVRKDYEQAAKSIGQAIGASAGAVIGGIIGSAIPGVGTALGAAIGASIGAVIGDLVGGAVYRLGGDGPGTKERKGIDSYFAKLFEGGRLGVVIGGQIYQGLVNGVDSLGEEISTLQPTFTQLSDLVFEGLTPFAGRVDFGGQGFTSYFETLSSGVQASFNGVGIALGQLLGVSVESSRLIGTALANNVGGSLQNLQVILQATGESFDDLAKAVLDSFLSNQLTIEEAYNSLVQLQDLYGVGIPGAIGAYQEAIDNLNISLRRDNPGRYAIDSLRDIGAEGAEAKRSFDSVISSLATTFGFAADQQARLFEALRINGITSLQQLAQASDEQLLAILRNIQLIRDNATAPLVATPQTTFEKPSGGGAKPSGPKKKTPQEIAAELLAKQREEATKLLKESQKYLDITDQINKGLIDRLAAGKQLIGYEKEILDAIIRRDKVEEALNKQLAKGAKGNAQKIAEYSAELRKLEDFLKGVSEKAAGATRQFKSLNLAGVIPFIKSANMLGVVATQVGVNLQKATDILIKGFLQGRLSLAELNKELDRTKETLGPGIPNAVGAVTDAFQGLIDAGVQGGQFSVDAFQDIFAEFREKFQKEGSALRQAERRQLEANLRLAQEAFNNALGPEASAAAKKTLDEVRKSLDDFNAVVPAPDLSELRNQLNQAFGPEQVDKFFQALDESGLRSFEDFEKAGVDSIVGILQKLESLGFNFNDTSQAILDAQQKLREGEQEANAGLDPLQEAINLIKDLNNGAGQLPSVFNGTTAAIEGLNGPLTALRDGFDDILEKLAVLSQKQSFEKDIVFNVSTVGESGAKALVEVLFGDGTGLTGTVGGTTSGGGASTDNASQIARIKKEIARLQKKGQTQAVRNKIGNLKRKLAELGG
jgi:hypothetical protein